MSKENTSQLSSAEIQARINRGDYMSGVGENVTHVQDNHAPEKPFDHVSFIIGFESGSCNDQEIIEGFQNLINAGIIWSLQGSYGRTARQLIDGGHCHE